MPQHSATPGVYMYEMPAQSQTIQGVSTSVAAFVGIAPWGPVNTPTRITSWISFARTFGVPYSKETPDGPFMDNAFLAHAVYGYFANGGAACWVVRVGPETYGTVPQAELPSANLPNDANAYVAVASEAVTDAPLADPNTPAEITLTLTAEGDVKPPSPPSGDAASGPPAVAPLPTYTLEVKVTGLDPAKWKFDTDETHTGLTAALGAMNIASVVNAKSRIVQLMESGGVPPGVQRIPQEGSWTLAAPAPPTGPLAPPPVLVGDPNDPNPEGLLGLAMAEEVSTICIPDSVAPGASDDEIREAHTALADFCTQHQKMAILDPPPGYRAQDIQVWQQSAETPSTAYATLYWPWIKVMHPTKGGLIEVPPSGHMAGLWARVDTERGVFKAPANEIVMGAVDVSLKINDADQDPLNANGVNCIRGFPGRGIRAWGARTLATDSDTEWMYLSVRRLFNFVEQSIAAGTTWAVFEPNDEMLWGRLRVSVTNFLTGLWREGALFGATPAQAFFVKCDSDTNPPDAIAAGEVNVQVGIAPVEPAEFVIFTVSQYQLPAAA